jgi:hypothetical protein
MKGFRGALWGLTTAASALLLRHDGRLPAASGAVSFGDNPYYYDHWCNHVANSLTYLVC